MKFKKEKTKMKKYVIILAIALLLFGTVGIVSAMNPQSYKELDFFEKVIYGFDSGNIFGLFTTWGQVNDCSVYPDKELYPIKAGERVDCDDGGCGYDKCAIDVWYDKVEYLNFVPTEVNWDYLRYYTEKSGEGAYFKASTSHDYWYAEIYCCPSSAPEVSDHSTRAYVCKNNEWDSKSRYDSDEYCSYDPSGVDLCWCADEDDNFYVDDNDGVHCRSSPRDSWCGSYVAHDRKVCTSAEKLYWYDSKGDINSLIESCSSSERCTTSGCVKKDVVDDVVDEDTGTGETCIAQGGTCKNTCDSSEKAIGNVGQLDCKWLRSERCCVSTTVSDTIIDSDGDGYSDAVEVEEGTDPNDANDAPTGTPIGTGVSSCVAEEEIFNTQGDAVITTKSLFKGKSTHMGSFEDNVGLIKETLPLVYTRYATNKATACCDDLDLKFVSAEKGSFEKSSNTWVSILNFIGQGTPGMLIGGGIGTTAGPVGTIAGGTVGFVVGLVSASFTNNVLRDVENVEYSYDVYKCVPEGEAGFCLEFAHKLLNPLTKSDDCQMNSIILGALAILAFILLARLGGGR